MPVPTETLWNLKKANLWFALSGLALMGSTLWMLWDDYDRDWRTYQRSYFQLQAVLAEMDWLDTQTSAAQDEFKAAKQALTEAEASVGEQQAELDEIRGVLDDLQDEAEPMRMDFAAFTGDVLVMRDEYEKAKALFGDDAAETRHAKTVLDDAQEKLRNKRAEQEKNADAQAEHEEAIKGILSARDEAQKAVDALLRAGTEAETRKAMLTKFIYRAAFNTPLLDFAAPKGTPGREEVKQLVLYNIKEQYNFTQTYRVDRCTTCHVGVDQKGLTRAALIARFEQAVPAMNERLKRQKRKAVDRPSYTNVDDEQVDAWADLTEEDQTFWLAKKLVGGNADDDEIVAAKQAEIVRMSESQRLDTVLTHVLEPVNGYLASQGMAQLDLKSIRPLLAHPRLDLFVGPDSKHPMAQMGCTVCHEGNGDETDFVFAAHTARGHDQLEQWEHDYVPMIGAYDFHTIEHYWDTPMFQTKYTSASCRKCHSQTSELTTFDAQPLDVGRPVAEGRELFTQLGCINCHLTRDLEGSRRVGPDLTHLAAKVTKPFAAEWIFDPQGFRPSTNMPHFFMQENNGADAATPDDPDPVARTKTETAALTHYLWEMSRLSHLQQADQKPWTPSPAPEKPASVERGRALFDSVGCLACHAALEHRRFPADPDGQIEWVQSELGRQGNDNAAEAAKNMTEADRVAFLREHYPTIGQDWITADLVARESLEPAAAKTRYDAMRYTDRVLYAMKHFADGRATLFDPDSTTDQPVFTRFGPELSSIRSKFESDERASAWLYDWVRNPRHYSESTNMPSLRLTDDEAVDLAAYLSTLNANAAFNERVAEADIQADGAMVDALLMTFLRGQNSEASARQLLEDTTGRRTRILESLLTASFGKERVERVVEQIEDPKLFYLGSRLMTHYGCYACHKVIGYENTAPPGTELTDWGEKRLAMLDFAFFAPAFDKEREQENNKQTFDYIYRPEHKHLIRQAERIADASTLDETAAVLEGRGILEHHEVLHNHGAFAYHKLRNPRIWDREKLKGPYSKLKMPNYYLTADESDKLVTYLLSRRTPLVREAVKVQYGDTPTGRLARGRHLVRELNCVACHRIEDNAAVVHQYFRVTQGGQERFDEVNAPPWLRGQGAKVQPAWLYDFFGDVSPLRPWLKIRMPSFHLDAAETRALVDYFVGVSQHEAAVLERHLAPIRKYVQGDRAAAGKERALFAPLLEADNESGVDWHGQDLLTRSAAFVVGYGRFNRFAGDDPADPFLEPDEQTEAYRMMLNQAAFTADLYDVAYPFVPQPPGASAADLAKGKELFDLQQCLACHKLGDEPRPDGSPPVSAPDLGLAHKRLRYDWTQAWLQKPAVIQPGTQMPANFGSDTLESAFAGDEPAVRDEMEARFGKSGGDQIKMIVDYLYQIGKQSGSSGTSPGAAAGE